MMWVARESILKRVGVSWAWRRAREDMVSIFRRVRRFSPARVWAWNRAFKVVILMLLDVI